MCTPPYYSGSSFLMQTHTIHVLHGCNLEGDKKIESCGHSEIMVYNSEGLTFGEC